MSPALKNKLKVDASEQERIAKNWTPSASLTTLSTRAKLLSAIRQFFSMRSVMEVETPLLCATSVTDPFIHSIPAWPYNNDELTYYLQTSPEYAMKRLLAAGMGSIFQISKAFRQGELGKFHNPEFTLLEWYRLGFDHHDLMDEMDAFLQQVANCNKASKISYRNLFQTHLQIDPFDTHPRALKNCALQNNIYSQTNFQEIDPWLDLLMTHCIEPQLGHETPCFVYDFPASQAALAKIRNEEPKVASRFEVYLKGCELANGFHELQNSEEQRIRFEKNLCERQKQGFPALPLDKYFLKALEHGLPDCAGVALGIDRLLMGMLNLNTLGECLSFDFHRA